MGPRARRGSPGPGPRPPSKRAADRRRTERRWPCPRYAADEQGTHTQCRFGDISGFADGQHRFVVNGASRDAAVRCSERVALLSDIGEWGPAALLLMSEREVFQSDRDKRVSEIAGNGLFGDALPQAEALTGAR